MLKMKQKIVEGKKIKRKTFQFKKEEEEEKKNKNNLQFKI